MEGKKKNTRQTLLRILLPLATAGLLIAAILLGRDYCRMQRSGLPNAEEKRRPDLSGESFILYNGERFARRQGVESYLLLGVDDSLNGEPVPETETLGGQTDVLLLLVLDTRADTYTVLQINRDSVTRIPVLTENGTISGEILAPLCLAHAFGSGEEESCENTIRAIQYLLPDVEISGYAAMGMDTIGAFNDAVGGVTVTIDRDLTRLDPSFTRGASVRLTAETAEAYLRARRGIGEENNIYRMERQRQYLDAWIRAAREKGGTNGAGWTEIIRALEPKIITDMTEKKLVSLAEKLYRYSDGGFVFLDGENVSTDSYNEYHVDEDSIRETLIRLFYEIVCE